MPIIEHKAPIYEGECPLDFPKAEDPRMAPFIENCRNLGVIDAEGKMLKQGTFIRGGTQDCFFCSFEYKD